MKNNQTKTLPLSTGNKNDFFEAICFARVYGAACGQIDKSTISKQEVDVTIEFLKKFTDNRNDWTQEQKDNYKLIADYVKETIKQDIDRRK